MDNSYQNIAMLYIIVMPLVWTEHVSSDVSLMCGDISDCNTLVQYLAVIRAVSYVNFVFDVGHYI